VLTSFRISTKQAGHRMYMASDFNQLENVTTHAQFRLMEIL